MNFSLHLFNSLSLFLSRSQLLPYRHGCLIACVSFVAAVFLKNFSIRIHHSSRYYLDDYYYYHHH